MKKEYICYYFDKYFKGKINNSAFNIAKNRLFCLLVIENVDVAETVLKDFTKNFYEIRNEVERELDAAKNAVNDESFFNSLNFIRKASYKRELKNLRKTYSNFGRFNDLFFEAFGTSLVKIKDVIDNEEKQNVNADL